MSTLIEDKLRQYPSAIITESELAALLDGTPDSRYARIRRAVEKDQLIRIKRGLYCLSRRLISHLPHPFELAQLIYGPSYISLESALAYHGLIPEAVHTITSVTIKRKKQFLTPLACFAYLHLPTYNFFTEVNYVKQKPHQYFIASPWKALLDYIHCYKKNWSNLTPVSESLRIEVDDLPIIEVVQLQELQTFYNSNRINRFIKNIPKKFICEH